MDSSGDDTKLADDEVEKDGETIEKYQRFKENLLNPDIRRCSKCGNSQTGDPKDPILICTTCSHRYCYTHGDQHPNTTCNEYERKHHRENLINAALIAKISKPCPKCKSPIQKRSGCNHMKCPKCQASFCWLCMSEIEDKPMPDHFKETNLTSGCRGKQFGGPGSPQENRPVGPCGVCVRSFFALFVLLFVALPSAILTLITFIVISPCLCGCAPFCHVPRGDLGRFVIYSIFRVYSGLITSILLFIIGLVSLPCFCIFCCFRGFFGGATGQDDDDRMAHQYEEEAAREVNYRLIQEEKVADLV